MKPVLEVNENCVDRTTRDILTSDNGSKCGLMISPIVSSDYWLFRVKLCKDQAVLGFPKCGMVGVGMALENKRSDTNLPLHPGDTPLCNAWRIYDHIKLNKEYKSITRAMIVDAIVLITKGAERYCKKGERIYEC
jgi:hypothetical protein